MYLESGYIYRLESGRICRLEDISADKKTAIALCMNNGRFHPEDRLDIRTDELQYYHERSKMVLFGDGEYCPQTNDHIYQTAYENPYTKNFMFGGKVGLNVTMHSEVYIWDNAIVSGRAHLETVTFIDDTKLLVASSQSVLCKEFLMKGKAVCMINPTDNRTSIVLIGKICDFASLEINSSGPIPILTLSGTSTLVI